MPRTDDELVALWAAVFGEPPPVTAAAGLLLDILVRHLPPAPPYGGPTALDDNPRETPARSDAPESSRRPGPRRSRRRSSA